MRVQHGQVQDGQIGSYPDAAQPVPPHPMVAGGVRGHLDDHGRLHPGQGDTIPSTAESGRGDRVRPRMIHRGGREHCCQRTRRLETSPTSREVRSCATRMASSPASSRTTRWRWSPTRCRRPRRSHRTRPWTPQCRTWRTGGHLGHQHGYLGPDHRVARTGGFQARECCWKAALPHLRGRATGDLATARLVDAVAAKTYGGTDGRGDDGSRSDW